MYNNTPMSIVPEKIKAICFDIDGTLNDTDDQFIQKVLPFFNLFKLLTPGGDSVKLARRFIMWLEAPGNFILEVPDILGIDTFVYSLIDRINQLNTKKIKTFEPISGVIPMIERLSAEYPLAIVSARSEATSREFVTQMGLEKYFKVIIGSLTTEHTKPYPDPILFAAKALGVKPEECLMVGDTVVDVKSGRSAGAQTVGVLCGFGEEYELKKAGADIIIETTSALLDLLHQ